MLHVSYVINTEFSLSFVLSSVFEFSDKYWGLSSLGFKFVQSVVK